MENKFTSFAYEEERSTYTEGESRSKRSSILKPPKARAPLQEVNLGGSADDTGDFDTLRKRRVSFAGVNSVKEFCSNAESAQVCHIQSYEETFSTSSDSSEAKSLLGTPKNVSSTDDKNFADDPMELTDSIIDNHPISHNRSAQLVRVEPVLTANALTEGAGFLRNPQGQTWNARKSALEHEEGQSWNARGNHGPFFTAEGEHRMNLGGGNFGAVPRLAKPDELTSQWSCSMEMTEPLKKRTSTAQPSDTPFHFGLSSSKPALDSGMELTETVGKMPNLVPNFLVDDNLSDASMEMTEAIDRGGKYVGFTSSTNKSASMEFTEVVRKTQTPFTFSQSSSGMELTEPVMATHHDHMGVHHEPMARHSLFTSVVKGQPLPRLSYSTTPGKSTTQSPGNKSSCDMEMTGVLSLSKASGLVAQEAEDDMDITQLVMPCTPLRKKSRLSNEGDDDPFRIGRHLDPADKENMKLPLVELSVSIPGSEAEQPPVTESAPKNNFGKPIEEDDDTLALNFDNVKRGNEPVELSFLKEFKDSSPVLEHVKPQIDLFSSKKPLQYDVPDDHLLLFSLSNNTEDFNSNPPLTEGKPIERKLDSNPLGSVELNKIPPVVSGDSALPTENDVIVSKPEPFTDDFLARCKGKRSDVEQLRGVRKSSSVENDNFPPMRMSFKDFEIKSDLTTTVMMNTSLSTVGLDDSNILKAGFNDLACPTEQVPACVSQLDITARTPKPSATGKTSLARSMMSPHAPGLDNVAENSPILKEDLGAEARKSEYARYPPREDDNTTHTSFSRPFYLPIPDKSDTEKHDQILPSLDLEPTEVGINQVEITDTIKRQSIKPASTRKSLLPQNLVESCSMELTDVLNRKSIPVQSIITPMRVSKHDATDMELSVSICTDETLPRKSSPFPKADESYSERPSSMDETNLAEPATIFKDITKKMSQPPQDSAVSITSEETVCKLNVTNCAVQCIGTDSGDTMDTEETLVKSKLAHEIACKSVENAKNISRVSQSHTKSHFFPGMSTREETNPSELTDNHLINAGLNSTFSFNNFGSKGSTENVLEPARKSNAAQSVEDVSAAHRPIAPSGPEAQPDDPKIVEETAETLDSNQPRSRIRMSRKSNYFGNLDDEPKIVKETAETLDSDQPRSRIRMSRKSNYFGNLDDDVKMQNILPERYENYEVSGHVSNLKSSGVSVDEVEYHASRKSVRVIPISNEEISDSENLISRKSKGFIQGTLPSNQFAQEFGAKAAKKSIKVNPNLIGMESSQPLETKFEITICKNTELVSESGGFMNRAERKSIKIIPNLSREESSEAFSIVPVPESSLELQQIPVPSIETVEKVGSQALDKSVRIAHNSNTEKPTDTMNEPLDTSESTLGSTLHRKSIAVFGQESQDPKTSVETIPNTIEGSCDPPQLRSGSVDVEVLDDSCKDSSNDEESMESPVKHPTRMPRKSCVGVKMNSSSEIEVDKHHEIDLGDVSEEFEFAIKRNKRKSAIDVKSTPDADSDKESQNLDIDSGIKVSHDEVQPGWSTDDDRKMTPDKHDHHLSQILLNVSINDDYVNDFTDDERMHVSTPCKPRLSSRLKDDDGRKRSLKPATSLPSDDGGVHDLSQDLMNVSLESDTRSPMLKKTCASPQVRIATKSNAARKSLAPMSPLADKRSSARESLVPQPVAKLSSLMESMPPSSKPSEQLFELRAFGTSSSTASLSVPIASAGESGMTEGYANLWGLSHEVRVKNRDFMAANDFTHLNRQIYEVWLFGEVIGLKATFPNFCELDEDSDVISVTYTFKDWKLKLNHCDKEVFEFYKNRLLETLPKQQLTRDCRRVSDLFRIARSLKKLNADSRPLIERMNYLKSRYPCQIHKDCIEFVINDAQRMLKFAVKIDLLNDTLSDDSISITNLRGQVKEDVVKLMFRVLPLQKDTFYTFVKELRNNSEKLLVFR